jgi:N-acetylglutamate synthase-like GNAT family acetyltransferase
MSTHYLTLEQIKSTINDINYMHNLIYQLEDQIKNMRQIIENKKDFLIANCKHDVQINRHAYSEHTEFYCTICKMDL